MVAALKFGFWFVGRLIKITSLCTLFFFLPEFLWPDNLLRKSHDYNLLRGRDNESFFIAQDIARFRNAFISNLFLIFLGVLLTTAFILGFVLTTDYLRGF